MKTYQFSPLHSPARALRGALTVTLSLGAALAASTAAAKVAYVRSEAGAPWGASTNEEAMDLVFGAGAWDDLRYESVNVDALLGGEYTFIYMEGGDGSAEEMDAFVSANIAAIEAYVDGGGALFMNSAPNEGAGMNWGFGGVTLNYPDFPTDPGMAVDESHPIWKGPHLPVATSFTGSSYAHASVSGPGLDALILDSDGGEPNLAELQGKCAAFGGLTTSNFWDPNPEALNLRANVIEHLVACVDAVPDSDKDGVSDDMDICPNDANPGLEDEDGDGVGDLCDDCPADAANDADGDKICGDLDNCPDDVNPDQEDEDSDGLGDACDACPSDASNDVDGDGVCGAVDNCPDDANPGQEDEDEDGVGDACDEADTTDGTTGDTTDGTTGGTTDGTTGGETAGETDGTSGGSTGGGSTGGGGTTGGGTTSGGGTTGDTEGDSATDTEGGGADGEGCNCAAPGEGSAPTGALWGLLALLGIRRRRGAAAA